MPDNTNLDRTLYANLIDVAKTTAQWAASDRVLEDGEWGLEKIPNDNPSGYLWSFRAKIGDGQTLWSGLPYFGDIVSLNGEISLMTWDSSNEKLCFYKIVETKGIISVGALILTLAAGTKLNISANAVSGRTDTVFNHQTTEQTTITATLTDHGTFTVATDVDATGHVTQWTTYTLPNIASAIATAIGLLDSTIATTANNKVLTGVTESDGTLTGFTETEIKGDDNYISVTGANGSITIAHLGSAPTVTDNRSNVGERATEVVTNMTVDNKGHVTAMTKDMSTNLVAADIKAPVKVENNNMFTFRETGDPVSISEDAAKITVIKGNTLVLNQLVRNFNSWSASNGSMSYSNNILTYTVTRAVGLTSQYAGDMGAKYAIAGHKYYISVHAMLEHAGTIYIGGDAALLSDKDFPIPEANVWTKKSYIEVAPSSFSGQNLYFSIYSYTNDTIAVGDKMYLKMVRCIDLTKMFGETIANSMTVEAFEKLFPAPYYPYCEGRLINLGGYHVKLNQLAKNGNFESVDNWNAYDGAISAQNNILTYTTESPSEGNSLIQAQFPDISGHKYLFRADLMYSEQPSRGYLFYGIGGYYGVDYAASSIQANKWFTIQGITTSTGISATQDLRFYFRTQSMSVGSTVKVRNAIAIDLTEMFGSGSEPTTVEEVEAILSLIKAQKGITDDYIPYTEGEDLNPVSEMGIESTGFNQWDEEWELGSLNVTTGEEEYNNNYIRCKNYIPVIGGSTYYFLTPIVSFYVLQYDSNKNYLGYYIKNNATSALDTNVAYIKIVWPNTEYGTTYNNDICINISDPSRNGTYEPYKKDTLDLSFIKDLGIPNFNIWDEEWEAGAVNWNTGEDVSDDTMCRNKGFIPVIEEQTYYVHADSIAESSNLIVVTYDKNRGYVGHFSGGSANKTFTIPSGVAYIRFTWTDTTYNHDICINKSVPGINGTYLPHGEKCYYFPYGLQSAGDAFDEVHETYAIKRVGIIDLGDLSWTYTNGFFCSEEINNMPDGIPSGWSLPNAISTKYKNAYAGSGYAIDEDGTMHLSSIYYNENKKVIIFDSSYLGDSNAFKKGCKGIPLVYEIEAPIRIDFDTPANLNYAVDDKGTEALIPQNTSNAVVAAPFAGTITYMSNFKEAVLDLIDRVNSYVNPVKGKNNTAQTEGKLAEYDSDHTVHSSIYAPSNATIVAGQDGNEYILPSVAALVAYVQTLISSALHYRGTVASWAALPSSGQQTGDLYIFSAADSTHTPPIGIGDFAIWNGSSWDLIQGTVTVTNSNPTLVLNGQTYTIGTVEGVSLTLVTPNLQMNDPSANGTANDLEVITNVSQTNGQMAATKRVIPSAGTSQKGVVRLVDDIHNSTAQDKVPTAKQAWDEFAKRNTKAVPVGTVSPAPNIYGPYYDPASRSIVVRLQSGVTYDPDRRCIVYPSIA